MEASKQKPTRYLGYPKPVEAPVTPYNKSEDSNPVVSGTLLRVGAWLISNIDFVSKFLWSNAHFDNLRGLEYLEKYTERWDPLVIPLAGVDSTPSSARLDSESFPMQPENIPGRYYSISEYHAHFLSGQLTPLAVVQSLIPFIRRDIKDKSYHSTAFIDSHIEDILAAAKASTLRYKSGNHLSIFDGVPTGIKDDCDVVGYRTTGGRKMSDNFKIASESTWPVQKLVEAGMICLGKLNMHELGADTTNNNPNWSTPRNPHNEQYYTGGSSGGPGYVVSAGLAPVTIGSDGGGSIRIPAAFCGIYGLKPSHGRLENTGSTVTVSGPLAATMSDLEAAYRVISVPNPSDSECSLFAPRSPPFNHPKTIGICRAWFNRADPSVLKTCEAVVSYYEQKLGYTIIDITLPYIAEGQSAHALTILAEMANRARSNPSKASTWLTDLTPANKVLLSVSEQTPARDYILAQQLRQMLMQHLSFLYTQHPGLFIVTPVCPMAGWPISSLTSDLKYGVTDANKSVRAMEYVWLANFCGNPAISCPAGYVDPVKGEGKIPIGIMAMGEWGSEDALIEWGRECEGYLNEVYPGGRQRPGNWEDVVANAKKCVQ